MLKYNFLNNKERKPLIPEDRLGFGKHFSDHMFLMKFSPEKGWHDAEIKPYGRIELDPAANCLHYSQEVFEGLKAYNWGDKICLFRPEENAKRLNSSAQKLCMQTVPEKMQLQAIRKLIQVDERWVPSGEGTSLYIRPTLIGTTAELGVKASQDYLFYIILSPSGAYFKEGFKPLSILVTDKYSRAAPGGVGNAKAAGNYAASLRAQQEAKEAGCAQTLFLDAAEKKYLEEVGAMNVFIVKDEELSTPDLTGTILPGITRKSVLELAPTLGISVVERKISIDEVIEGIESGKVTEMGGTGTAAVVASVGSLVYKGKKYQINKNKIGPITQQLYDELTSIQYGKREDKFGWMKELDFI